jgi:hypothetical protein
MKMECEIEKHDDLPYSLPTGRQAYSIFYIP